MVPVASFTVTKLRWLAEHEPASARATAAVCLPHDWLTWRLRGADALEDLVTDRSDASGTGYWSAETDRVSFEVDCSCAHVSHGDALHVCGWFAAEVEPREAGLGATIHQQAIGCGGRDRSVPGSGFLDAPNRLS